MDGVISDANQVVVDNSFNYPYGTTEQFPLMEDTDLGTTQNSAHYYMECSNKGKCDRTTGTCACYPGYEGVACQRASCPNSCSGHGVCQTISQLAEGAYGVPYKLWDKKSTMGCKCDAGYSGPDCSQRTCKHGADPLYLDDSATMKYSEFNFATLVTAHSGDTLSTPCVSTAIGNGQYSVAGRCMFNDGQAVAGEGFWAIRFYDAQGEDWLTQPITAGASCATVIAALENLPNNVIPPGTTQCDVVSRAQATDELYVGQAASYNNGLQDKGMGTWTGKYDTNPNPKFGQGLNPYVDSSGWEIYNNMSTSPGVYNLHRHPWHMYFKMSLWEAELTDQYIAKNTDFWGVDSNPTMSVGEDNAFVPITDFLNSAAKSSSHFYVRGYIYNIRFWGNPGKLRQPEIEVYLDGARPSLVGAPFRYVADSNTYYSNSKVITKVWTDGKQGEDNDYFADHCDGVQVTINHVQSTGSPTTANAGESGLSSLIVLPNGAGITQAAAVSLLKTCLGDADFDTSNNNDVYNWDHGSFYYPHIIKLVRSVTTYTDGGFYAVLYYDDTHWNLLNPFIPPDEFINDRYEVYTTKGTLALVSNKSAASFGFGSNYIYTSNVTYDLDMGVNYDGDVSCEIGMNNAAHTNQLNLFHCLNVSDMFTFLNWNAPQLNPPHINLYTAKRLYTKPYQYSTNSSSALAKASVDFTTNGNAAVFGPSGSTSAAQGTYGTTPSITTKQGAAAHYMTHVITTDLSTNWGISINAEEYVKSVFYLYKFFPARASTYNYVNECSNRGTCNRATGVCQCFPGYTNDDCSIQSSISL